ncbi:hypothetical protein VTL71DRAFT_10205 [Oculimacula yallundae]|uniref:Uncharacterized protein n=1 Tax=Oculimacula yallundae TaxID=86028 RepID=A0ABR4BRT0_9HELO
MPLTILGSSE